MAGTVVEHTAPRINWAAAAGTRFGSVVAVRPDSDPKKYVFVCDCGSEFAAYRSNAASGDTRSCGCSRRRNPSRLRHGDARKNSESPEYITWLAMRSRCGNPKNKSYFRYGARGIRVCDLWETSFEFFLADMGRRPTPLHSLERNENDGNYEPGNCRWVTKAEQARNRRSARFLTFRGETKAIWQWAEATGFSRATIEGRLKKGWSVERTLTEPVRWLTATMNGKTKRLTEWAREYGMNYYTLRARIRSGWTIETALASAS